MHQRVLVDTACATAEMSGAAVRTSSEWHRDSVLERMDVRSDAHHYAVAMMVYRDPTQLA